MTVRLLRYGFDDLQLSQIGAITNFENTASQRVLLKAGLVRRGERSFTHPALAPRRPDGLVRGGSRHLALVTGSVTVNGCNGVCHRMFSTAGLDL